MSSLLARLLVFEPLTWRALPNRVRTVQLNNAFRQRHGVLKALVACSVSKYAVSFSSASHNETLFRPYDRATVGVLVAVRAAVCVAVAVAVDVADAVAVAVGVLLLGCCCCCG